MSGTSSAPLTRRDCLENSRRIVIKVGSSSLTGPDGALHQETLDLLVNTIAEMHARGVDVVLVSSGAVAAGIGPLKLGRPRSLREKQAAAMVGQSRLMAAYEERFEAHDISVGQVLLTASDVTNRRHYANALTAMRTLLRLRVVPIVNENDAVATDELRFGDNDRLAALTAHLVGAGTLILLTDVDGLYTKPPSEPGATRIAEVTSEDDLAGLRITGRGSAVGTGGMRTKVAAAELATSGGVGVILTHVDNVQRAVAGENVGTWFVPSTRHVSARGRWMEFAARARGRVTLDDGAVAAITGNHASLLPVGVIEVSGRFAAGDIVELCDGHGEVIARGLSAYSVEELIELVGSTRARGKKPVVHANDIVLLGS
ncbi:glutamate 5-kinase [Actinotignum timonense]|uniref:glutamate 5-kinase n=1 Tax=Actinotignum timonense TaxID=1870995 RepID=UPI00254B0490|nr:glutamate 5-kinase [Actinotignum timonense]MDK8781557.1 glutamate 5-kinase [Actinotignum timonense]